MMMTATQRARHPTQAHFKILLASSLLKFLYPKQGTQLVQISTGLQISRSKNGVFTSAPYLSLQEILGLAASDMSWNPLPEIAVFLDGLSTSSTTK
uniref:HSPC072 n=1 Tax=Homo sapiens TaxID=9606 RepID=Q9NZW7_HUMAN|nr:HSPC072 [Homo sapiens]